MRGLKLADVVDQSTVVDVDDGNAIERGRVIGERPCRHDRSFVVRMDELVDVPCGDALPFQHGGYL